MIAASPASPWNTPTIISITPAKTAKPTVHPLTSRAAISPPFLACGGESPQWSHSDNRQSSSRWCDSLPGGTCDKRRVRINLARVLVFLGALFAVLSLLAAYIRFQGLDTNTVRNTADDLISDKEIRDQVAATLVDQFYANVDVQAELEKKLPPEAQGLAGPASAGLRELSDRTAVRMLERPRVQALWVNSVTKAHSQLVKVLEDDTGALSTENGAVVLDVQPLVV